MTTWQSAKHGILSSGDYFLSTFMFGVLFGITAAAIGQPGWQALLLGAGSFSASASFATLEFWQAPLPLGTIALSVFLVSTRNILLGMSMTYHFDGHSLPRRIGWLFFLNDPGVVTSFSQAEEVDRLGYVTGYGVSLMTAWLLSTLLGLNATQLFAGFDPGAVGFAGPLVIATMMMLFIKGSQAPPAPWVVSGIVALMLFEFGAEVYQVLFGSVLVGLVVAIRLERSRHD